MAPPGRGGGRSRGAARRPAHILGGKHLPWPHLLYFPPKFEREGPGLYDLMGRTSDQVYEDFHSS